LYSAFAVCRADRGKIQVVDVGNEGFQRRGLPYEERHSTPHQRPGIRAEAAAIEKAEIMMAPLGGRVGTAGGAGWV
jgi:hypothetical protein